jgi:hypothetical protein
MGAKNLRNSEDGLPIAIDGITHLGDSAFSAISLSSGRDKAQTPETPKEPLYPLSTTEVLLLNGILYIGDAAPIRPHL